MTTMDASDAEDVLGRSATLAMKATCGAALAFLVALFGVNAGTDAVDSVIGILIAAGFMYAVYWAWPKLIQLPSRDMPVMLMFGIYILFGLINWSTYANDPWTSLIGMMGISVFVLAVTAGWKEVRKAPVTAWFGMTMIFLYIVVSCMAAIISPYGEEAVMGATYQTWGTELKDGGTAVLGTDQLGRDFMSRLIYGARNTVGIAFATTALTFVVGSLLGLLAASLQGWVDQALSRVVDVLMAIPPLIFALVILSVVGTGALKMILIIALLDSTRVFRLARSVAMNIVVMDYVEAAKLRGERLWYIIWKEVLPNATAPLAAEFGLRFCFVFLFISSLSFLGLGLQPPTADWGAMVRESGNLINFFIAAPGLGVAPLLPAFAIAMLTVAVNFVVDWFLHKMSGLKE